MDPSKHLTRPACVPSIFGEADDEASSRSTSDDRIGYDEDTLSILDDLVPAQASNQ
jgi:hypothetical protein